MLNSGAISMSAKLFTTHNQAKSSAKLVGKRWRQTKSHLHRLDGVLAKGGKLAERSAIESKRIHRRGELRLSPPID
jgi:hypothetical protein